MGRLNNLGDHTGLTGDNLNLDPMLPGNGKGGDIGGGGGKPLPVEKEKKKKRTKKKSSVLQAKLNHLAGVIGQIGRSKSLCLIYHCKLILAVFLIFKNRNLQIM